MLVSRIVLTQCDGIVINIDTDSDTKSLWKHCNGYNLAADPNGIGGT
jgi:hypothetical protein